MTVAALSTAGFSQYIASSSNVSGSQKAWQSLEQSLAQGNLTAAQSAFNAYIQLNPAQTSSSGSGSSASSQLSTDMAALGSAIGSGNLSSAQSAFATVESDLKTTPPQAVANAESAAAQTVQWVDDLLSLSNSSNSTFSSTPVNPTTDLLDSAYGLNSSSSTTNPFVTLLESKYGEGSAASTSSAASSSTAGAGSTASAPSIVSSGNAGSGASVNAYA
jgi:cellulose 1,4-beta-cellobiosidase